MTNFADWFESITDKKPFPYQERLATKPELPLLLDVITGAGKTAAIILAWLWRRRFHPDPAIRQKTPRRMVYCLPMRTLVEQTYAEAEKWRRKACLTEEVELHLLMGGAVSKRWDRYPEKDCILIGTQDQLLSRALNRGYGMSRYRWPVHFALLNNDCLWVMDEVQLMGAGLRTSAQLQGFREEFGTYGTTKSLWMSATLNSEILQTVNYQPDFNQTQNLSEEDKVHPVLQQRIGAKKRLIKAKTMLSSNEKDYAKTFALEIAQAHTPGKLTLVICNRVSRAQAVYQELEKQKLVETPLLLIHSRFRGQEREDLNRKLHGFLSGILVATQAVEAGVDISAQILFTELAPWSSLVQRMGRCNRYGECSEQAIVYWVDIDLNKKESASPYAKEELAEARELLICLEDVSPKSLRTIRAKSPEVDGLIPRKHDLLQLFDTSTDLAGHDIDISSFIRETKETDVAIAWRNWEGNQPEPESGALLQKELCRVSIYQASKLLENLKKQQRFAWVWDGLQGKWVRATSLYPGMSLLLNCSGGGYSVTLGFTGDTKDLPEPVKAEVIEADHDDRDSLTDRVGAYITLVAHSQDVADEVRRLCENLSEYGLTTDLLVRAGQWHDLGKAHEAFQEMLTRNRPDLIGNQYWAKSDHRCQMKLERRGFRHELVSALVALQQREPFLLTYLVAAHHGKIRLSIQPRPQEFKPREPNKKYALGVWDGDDFPAIYLGNGISVEAQKLSLICMEMGEHQSEESWTAQAISLLEEHGPFKLAFLETIIRVADWCASAKYAPDILEKND